MAGVITHLRAHLMLVVIGTALGLMLLTGTVSYHYLEDWSWTESFYFTVCTLTTIGYGDLTPSSDASRLFTAFFALAGVGIAFGSFGALGSMYLRRGERLLARMTQESQRPGQEK